MACIRRFAAAILGGEIELALGTIRVNYMTKCILRLLKTNILFSVFDLIELLKSTSNLDYNYLNVVFVKTTLVNDIKS